MSPAVPPSQQTTSPSGDIIRVAAKGKGGRRWVKNVFADDRGYPDLNDDHDTLLHIIDGGSVLRKLRHPAPPLDKDDPTFTFTFDETLHGKCLRQLLNLSHLNDAPKTGFMTLLKNTGQCLTIAGYGCL